MGSADLDSESVRVHVENVGGISNAEVTFSTGVTVLVGPNATNRTSLLQGLTAALGSDIASLKADAETGSARISIGSETYAQRATRRNGTVTWDGDGYLEDAEAATLFAFLLETNEARRAVSQGGDLREIILRPIDTEAIEREIASLVERRETIDDRLAALDDLESSLADLEADRSRRESEIEDLEAELAQKREAVEASDSDPEDTVEGRDRLDERLETLRDVKSTLEDVEFELETETESIEALESELESLEDDLSEAVDPDLDRDAIADDIESLREEKRRLDSQLNDLQKLIQFNREMLEGQSSFLTAAFDDVVDRPAPDVTRELVDGSTTICWTCGSRVESDRVSETVDALKAYREEVLADQRKIEERLDDLQSKRDDLEARKRQREQLVERKASLESELADRRETVSELREMRTELSAETEELEAEIESIRSETDQSRLEAHEAVNDLEYELGRRENELDRIESNIEEIREQLAAREDLEAERQTVTAELAAARDRVERIEREAVDSFNEHMANLLDILDYDNISRIWLERRTPDDDGSQMADDRIFDLHIVRQGEEGTVYEDTIEHLSESERRLTGLIFGLAGYFAHDLSEDLPFMILDSLEAIDARRIAALLEYLRDHVPYLVVALLPEDAQYLEDVERIESF